jgi:ergothioneine biosynthesis protein EgtB
MSRSPSPYAPTGLELRASLDEARARTDYLFTLLRPGAIYDRAIAERHRLIFYLGHLEAFDWNLLAQDTGKRTSFRSEFDRLFAFGIDPIDGQLPSDQPADWPREEEVQNYVRRIREELDELLAGATDSADVSESANTSSGMLPDGTLLNVAIEHRLMHAETLAYLLHELPFKRKIPREMAPEPPMPAPSHRSVAIPAGVATLGLARSAKRFGWDNEFESHGVDVPAFSIAKYSVTNQQFMEFVRAGGYEQKSLWDAASWDWRGAMGLWHPHFWRQENLRWMFRGMFGTEPLPLHAPVYVSHAEASAYARWARKRLPTEAQWHRAAYGTESGAEREYPWGEQMPDASRGNFDFARWHPTAVNGHPAGSSAFGVMDLLGNGWEWTADVFAPFLGFQAFPFYPGYSANFFDGQHFVMKGGSPQTAACMLRRSFRNWFQPHYTYSYATFRCVEE